MSRSCTRSSLRIRTNSRRRACRATTAGSTSLGFCAKGALPVVRTVSIQLCHAGFSSPPCSCC
eukprot:6459779-Pyramimonas_sp.AAC.1